MYSKYSPKVATVADLDTVVKSTELNYNDMSFEGFIESFSDSCSFLEYIRAYQLQEVLGKYKLF